MNIPGLSRERHVIASRSNKHNKRRRNVINKSAHFRNMHFSRDKSDMEDEPKKMITNALAPPNGDIDDNDSLDFSFRASDDNDEGRDKNNKPLGSDDGGDPADTFPIITTTQNFAPPYSWYQCRNDIHCPNPLFYDEKRDCALEGTICSDGGHCQDDDDHDDTVWCDGWGSLCYNKETDECRTPEYNCLDSYGNMPIPCLEGETCVEVGSKWCGG